MRINITQKELKQLAACCANKHRPTLENIFLDVSGNRARVIATDGMILAVIEKELLNGERIEGELKTAIPAKLYKMFNSRADIIIESTPNEGEYEARDIKTNEIARYTAPNNGTRPNYDHILEGIKKAKRAADYAIFSPDVLKKIVDIIGIYDYQHTVPLAEYKNMPHFWKVDNITVVAMPYRS